jgi:hypothetical protein
VDSGTLVWDGSGEGYDGWVGIDDAEVGVPRRWIHTPGVAAPARCTMTASAVQPKRERSRQERTEEGVWCGLAAKGGDPRGIS